MIMMGDRVGIKDEFYRIKGRWTPVPPSALLFLRDENWQRGWDSNPRDQYIGGCGFAKVHLSPLILSQLAHYERVVVFWFLADIYGLVTKMLRISINLQWMFAKVFFLKLKVDTLKTLSNYCYE